MVHVLPELAYAYNSLEPFIDEATMRIHHDKHHQAYVDKFNAAVKATPLEEKSVEELLKDIDDLPESVKSAIKNNGGGHYNHSFFWPLLKKDVPAKGLVVDAIIKKFGSFDVFKKQFSSEALTQFGSGWAWLVLNEKKELELMKTANQDTPISVGKVPLLCIDVWEHAYYLRYQNKRADYIEAFFNIINWGKVNELYLAVMK